MLIGLPGGSYKYIIVNIMNHVMNRIQDFFFTFFTFLLFNLQERRIYRISLPNFRAMQMLDKLGQV